MANTLEHLKSSIQSKDLSFSKKEKIFINSLLSSRNAERLDFFSQNYSNIFSDDEIAEIRNAEKRAIFNNGMRHHSFLIMKATRLCNLRCSYCHSWRAGKHQTMPFSILVRAIADTLHCKSVKNLDVIWHGGEVTLLPVAYFKKALWIQEYFRDEDQKISNSIQTNATLLTDDWIELLHDFDIAVGVSIDGSPDLHDSKRKYANGKGSWKNVAVGLQKLSNAGVKFGGLAVISPTVIERGARDFLEYFIDLGLKGVALLNVIPENKLEVNNKDNYLPWDKFVSFMRELFEIWWGEYRERIIIRELQALVDSVMGKKPTICEFAGNCMGQFITVDPNGDVSACDKYIDDQSYIFGNLINSELPNILEKSSNLTNARLIANNATVGMKKCDFYKYCNGGCPHDVRLNQMYAPSWDANCCGMSLLFQDIFDAINNLEKSN